MTDDTLLRELKNAHAVLEAGRVVPFQEVFGAAEARLRRARQRRRIALAAAAAGAAALLYALLPEQPDWQYVDPELFATSTSWSAPSDVLLPQRRFDIYEDIPVLIESTESDEGALL